MSRVTILRCDSPDCPKQFRAVANIEETRRQAKREGWQGAGRNGRRVDYCPSHAGLRTPQ